MSRLSKANLGGPHVVLYIQDWNLDQFWAAIYGKTCFGWCGIVTTSDGVVALRFGDQHEAGICNWLSQESGRHRIRADPLPTAVTPGRRAAERLARQAFDVVQAYLGGCYVNFEEIPVNWHLVAKTEFQLKVWQACRRIAYGSVLTYGELARQIRLANAARAVGAAMRQNPIPLLIPCHRVVGTRGQLTGYSAPGGVATKRRLLEMEKRCIQSLQ